MHSESHSPLEPVSRHVKFSPAMPCENHLQAEDQVCRPTVSISIAYCLSRDPTPLPRNRPPPPPPPPPPRSNSLPDITRRVPDISMRLLSIRLSSFIIVYYRVVGTCRSVPNFRPIRRGRNLHHLGAATPLKKTAENICTRYVNDLGTLRRKQDGGQKREGC